MGLRLPILTSTHRPLFRSGTNSVPIDEDLIEVEALPAGVGDDGNQFVFTAEDRWQFNLKTGSYTTPGTYTVFMESGDIDEYMLETPTCTAEFVVR